MWHAAELLAILCLVALLVNEGIHIKYGFTSNRHFAVFWMVHGFVLIGLGIALGIMLTYASRIR